MKNYALFELSKSLKPEIEVYKSTYREYVIYELDDLVKHQRIAKDIKKIFVNELPVISQALEW